VQLLAGLATIAALLHWRKDVWSARKEYLLLGAIALDVGLLSVNEDTFARPLAFRPGPYGLDVNDKAAFAEMANDRTYRIFRIPSGYDCMNIRYAPWGLYSSSGYDNFASSYYAELVIGFEKAADRHFVRCNMPTSPRTAVLTSTRVVAKENAFYKVEALPRVRLFKRYEVHAQAQEAVARLNADAFNPFDALVLGAAPAGAPLTTATEVGAASIAAESWDRVEVALAAHGRALLLLNDTWAQGWTATVDGRPSEILRANHAFRAVLVDETSRKVVFQYLAPGLDLGMAVSIAALLTWGGLFAVACTLAISARRRARPT
jgi:hypothetical protein